MTYSIVLSLIIFIIRIQCYFAKSKKDIPCKWNSPSGASYDLRSLTRYSGASYTITDGDIPCTPETEPSYGYSFNFCHDVTTDSINQACSLLRKSGVALQYIYLNENSYDCYVIGSYDPKLDDLSYSLLDNNDPTKGISMKYPSGERCTLTDGTKIERSATIDVQCDNVESVVIEALEPSNCQYHLVMKSFHGCPTSCAITKNGLCDSHGLCMYDSKSSQAYCYCNNGYYGDDCTGTVAPVVYSYNGYSVQLGLLITLLLITLILIAVIGLMIYKITELRKEQANYGSLPSSTEMVETVHFQ